jgi:hypothetical protein
MPFLATFACLWCGTTHTTRTADDLEGWAQLCPDCVGKAGDNGFLRFRLRQALTERGAVAQPVEGEQPVGVATAAGVRDAARSPDEMDRSMIDYYEARAPEYDDWYLRRGR